MLKHTDNSGIRFYEQIYNEQEDAQLGIESVGHIDKYSNGNRSR